MSKSGGLVRRGLINARSTGSAPWVDIGYPEAVGHHAVAPASPSHMVKAAVHGIAYYIPRNKEIGREAQSVDHLQLIPYPLHGLFVAAITVLQPVKSQLFQQQPSS
jgi:hypothetical protein